MLAVLNLPCTNGSTNNVFFVYDFKQVKDSVLLVMYVNNLKSMKKIFINYDDKILDTGILKFFVDDDKSYRQICHKIQNIFNSDTEPNERITLNFQNNIQDHAGLMLGILS